MGPQEHELRVLEAAIDGTGIIDNHAHPLLKADRLGKYPLLAIATEASGDALGDAWSSLAHIRAVKQLSAMLNCDASWDAVESAIEQQRARSAEAWTKRCLDGIATILLDDGLDGADQVHGHAWHDSFVRSPCKRIVRIEHVMETIIRRHLGPGGDEDAATVARLMMDSFAGEMGTSVADPVVVAFKSIICYRGGLDIPYAPPCLDLGPALEALKGIVEADRSGLASFRRLQSLPINHLLLHVTARLVRDSPTGGEKPIQMHTGLGDTDITLTRSSPSHLQTFVGQYPTVRIVILHAGYPWTREAGYLAAMYPNVYADIGEVFPSISRDGQMAVVSQILELCPWSKILWSTDGHWFPESYLLATTQIRSVLKSLLGEYVVTRQLHEKQAVQLVQDVLFNNSNKLYGLGLKMEPVVPKPSLLTPARVGGGSSLSPASPSPLPALLERVRGTDCNWVRIYWHDYTSSARCRLIPLGRVLGMLQAGEAVTLTITKVALGLLQTDRLIPQSTPTGAYRLHPDWSSLKLGPAPGHVSCYGDFREEAGSEAALCPRTLLRNTVAKASALGLSLIIGFELEFVILQRNSDSDSRDKYWPLDNDGHAWSMAGALSDAGRDGSFNSAIDEVLECLHEAGIEMEQFHAESAPGQYEVVLPPLPPLQACDTLLHARQIVSAVAARRGFRMTLHPKPYPASCGSASHVHMSISSPGGDTAALYEPFYAGLLGHLPAVLAFTYSNPASYERMADSVWAGGRWVAWGTQNKEAALRKCVDSHWELKTLDGLANPYLAIAAVIAAGRLGVVAGAPLRWRDCEPDPATLSDADRARLGVTEMLPATLGHALDALNLDGDLRTSLGPEMVDRYTHVKRAELAALQPMSELDRRRWLLERY